MSNTSEEHVCLRMHYIIGSKTWLALRQALDDQVKGLMHAIHKGLRTDVGE